jgi:hypothetical protein
VTLATAGKHEFLAPIHLQYVLEDKFILEKCECILVKNLRNRLIETNNEKKYSDSHKIIIKNDIDKIIIYSDSKFGTIRLQGNVISLAKGLNSFCLCNLRIIQKEYNNTQKQNYSFTLQYMYSLTYSLFTRLTQYHTVNKNTVFLYLHNIFHKCNNVPTGQETLPSLRTLTLAVSKVNINNVQKSELPATIVKDLPKITERFLSLKIHNDDFINWYTYINNIRYSEHYGVKITSCRCKKVGTTNTEIWWYHTMNRQAVVHIQ